MRNMSLRVRINLVITLVIVAFTIATGNLLIEETRRSIREEMEAGTRVTAQLLETVIANTRPSIQDTSHNQILLSFLQRVGRVRANEIRLYDGNDNLLYTSPPPVYKRGRWAPQWFTDLVKPKLSDFRLNLLNGSVVITPDPSRAVLDAWDDLKQFFWLMLGFFVLVNVVVFWLLGRSLRPVGKILGGLSLMEKGRFETRLPFFGSPEFDSIGHVFNRMAQNLEESLAENRRLALVAKQSSDAIIIHDLEGRISFWNPAAERMFGFRMEEIVGRSATLLTTPERHGEIQENLDTVKRRALIEMIETQRLTKDGRIVDVALSAAPLIDPLNDEVIGEICSMRDITEHKMVQQAERELEQNRQLTRAIQSRLEEERRSIARELHDELGQCVTAIKTIGTAISNRARETAPDTHENAQTIVSVASHIYDVVHGIIRQLRPTALDHLGLSETLRDTVSAWRERHPDIACDLRLEGTLEGLGETINITVYRIVQECLTNVIRHAVATRSDILVARCGDHPRGDVVRVVVRDNGKGVVQRAESEATRFGLIGMRERVQALDGEFRIDSTPGEGVMVTAVIPVKTPPFGSRDTEAA
ncbi:MAG: PAS domain S-box protein [Betaproteobacteria bacterium]|nr:PAS domain S-box protein [Betaproteobacteria bacterium]